MIAKHVPMRSAGKSDFAGLVKYITSSQGKQERLGDIRLTNLASGTLDAAVAESLATQRQNTRATGDKTYHLLVSFPSEERPNKEVLAAIEDRLCAAIGFGEHQRVSAVHTDTDHLHMHIAINKIHPTRLTLHEPYRAYHTLGKVASSLEVEFGLQQVNHRAKKRLSESRATDMERHSGIESLMSWIRSNCLEEIETASTWDATHQVLASNNLALLPRGRGFVFQSGEGVTVKASSISRRLSKAKLEARLGSFEPASQVRSTVERQYKASPIRVGINTDALFARYQKDQRRISDKLATLRQQASARKTERVRTIKKTHERKRSRIKKMKLNRVAKRVLYRRDYKALKRELQAFYTKHKAAQAATRKQYYRSTWADWLKQRALDGDVEALRVLRVRNAQDRAEIDGIKGEGGVKSKDTLPVDSVTKRGTVIYRVDKNIVRDDGDTLHVSDAMSFDSLNAALRVAASRYTGKITLTGSSVFKARVVRIAAATGQPVQFADPSLEKQRQALTRQFGQDSHKRSYIDIPYEEKAVAKELGAHWDGKKKSWYIDTTDAVNLRRHLIDKTHFTTDDSLQSQVNLHDRNEKDRHHISRRSAQHDRRNGVLERHPSGSINKQQSGIPKPYAERVGLQPPPYAQNRLRNLSELGVVRFTKGSEVLLPGYVPGDMEQQRSESNNTVRRGLSGTGLDQENKAVQRYISERESKREKGLDILKHKRYTDHSGMLAFAGIRNVDGITLALLKNRANEILVRPVDAASARRLKRVAIGDGVQITPRGTIKTTQGKSR